MQPQKGLWHLAAPPRTITAGAGLLQWQPEQANHRNPVLTSVLPMAALVSSCGHQRREMTEFTTLTLNDIFFTLATFVF
ncbi:hypothetical protein HKD37_02G004152 [Glycine soja]